MGDAFLLRRNVGFVCNELESPDREVPFKSSLAIVASFIKE